MGWQIIKQPNEKYCIFSSIVDNVVYFDGTPDQILNAFIESETANIRKRVIETINALDRGGKPYLQFTMSFDDMVSTIRQIHGDAEADKVKNMLK
jgi:hypothetical protein